MMQFPSADAGALAQKVKRFVIDVLVEPLIPLRRLESYLMFWARFVFRIRRPFVIGITGSVGKSTTTEMVATALAHPDAARIVGAVGHTFGNMNDDVGLSATLLRFDHVLELPWAYHRRMALLCLIPFKAMRTVFGHYPKVMVLEFGVGSTADFRRMVKIAPPNVSVVTRIGPAHLEILKTIAGVVQEKGELVRAVLPSGLVILGQDHDYVAQLKQMARAPVIKVSGQGIELSRNITRAICAYMGIPEEVANSALTHFKQPERRLTLLELSGMTVIDDTYNANPLSVKLGLDALVETAERGHRRLAVLGHMSELGDEAARYHQEVGAYARSRADLLIGIGELSRHYAPDRWFESSDACAAQIESQLCFGDCVLVKGSASAQMSKVVDKLREIAGRAEFEGSRC